MVFVRDQGSEFAAPLKEVWEFVSSGDAHSGAHAHRSVTRQRNSEASGTYTWEQPFDGADVRFSMRWTSFWPLGIGYEVLEGPFEGSRFFLIYEAKGERTGVEVVGEFVSPTLANDEIEPAVRRFFETEFDQDSEGLLAWARSHGAPT